jgi:2-iminobutanoate/2-iminopropanoate deaminase
MGQTPTGEDHMSAKRENFVPDTVYARIMDGKAMFPTAVSVEGQRMIFLSGQLAWDKDGNTVGKGDMRAQFEQVGENLKNGLEAAGATLDDVVKAVTYVTDMDAFFECVDIREKYFGPGWPTSTTFEVSRLAHPDMMIEIDMIAVV